MINFCVVCSLWGWLRIVLVSVIGRYSICHACLYCPTVKLLFFNCYMGVAAHVDIDSINVFAQISGKKCKNKGGAQKGRNL